MSNEIDELGNHDHEHEHEQANEGLGAGVEEGDLDTNRQMRMEKRGKNAAIVRNLMTPARKLKEIYQYARDNKLKSLLYYTASTTAGAGISIGGAKLLQQPVNIENTVSIAATTPLNYALAIAASNLALYTWQRGTDALAGSDYVISHKRVSKAGPIAGIVLATGLTATGNLYGDDVLKTYASPILDPLGTGARIVTFIPDKIVDAAFSFAEGTVLDTWVDHADTAACQSREERGETAFNLPCRGNYYDETSFTPFHSYLYDSSNSDGLAGAWDSAIDGLEYIGVLKPTSVEAIPNTTPEDLAPAAE